MYNPGPCETNDPCQNDGSCIDVYNTDGTATYKCQCLEESGGLNCQSKFRVLLVCLGMTGEVGSIVLWNNCPACTVKYKQSTLHATPGLTRNLYGGRTMVTGDSDSFHTGRPDTGTNKQSESRGRSSQLSNTELNAGVKALKVPQ